MPDYVPFMHFYLVDIIFGGATTNYIFVLAFVSFFVLFSEEDFLPQSSLGWSGSNPLHSAYFPQRCCMCCYVSSHRGGYLYRLSPGVSLVSTYRYTDLAYKVMVRALCLFYWKLLL